MIDVVLLEQPLKSCTRLIIARGSVVEIRRERRDGTHCGSVLIHADAQPALRAAIAAARVGFRGVEIAKTRNGGSIAFIVKGRDWVSIEVRRSDGSPAGGFSDVRDEELDRLAEALCIAAYVAAEAA